MILGLEDLRKLSKPARTEDIDCPALGGTVRIAQIGPKERIALGLELAMREGEANSDVLAAMWFDVLCASIVDEVGNRPFASVDGRKVLEGIDGELLAPIGTRAMDLNGFTVAAIEAAKAEAKKNASDSNVAAIGTLPLTSAASSDGPASIPTSS